MFNKIFLTRQISGGQDILHSITYISFDMAYVIMPNPVILQVYSNYN